MEYQAPAARRMCSWRRPRMHWWPSWWKRSGRGRKSPWEGTHTGRAQRGGRKRYPGAIASALRAEFNDPDKVTFASWIAAGRPRSGRSETGFPISARTGAAARLRARLSVGAAVALAGMGALMRSRSWATAISHGRHRHLDRPCAIASRCGKLIDNNRSYFNDELHQENVAKARGRDVEEPLDQVLAHGRPDARHRPACLGRARSGSAVHSADVAPALERGVRVLKEGGVCVIDFHVDPGEERQAGASVGQRKTGGLGDQLSRDQGLERSNA